MADARMLRIEFATEDSFRSEYASNIANGGIFISTRSEFAIREAVCVQITLGYADESVTLDGEVVHVVPPEMAETGATPGVAVQFTEPASAIRDRFRPLGAGDPSAVDERALGSGRRAAPRAPARVKAEVVTGEGETLQSRTRNISSTGALVSIQDEPVEVGSRIRLTLTHPATSEELEVEARVMRHVAGDDGEVAAMGVQFEAPEADRGRIEEFVGEIKASEHSRRLGGISGPISEIGIENVLQMFGKCSPSGTLTVCRGVEEGTIVFASGELKLALLGSATGVRALARMLSWTDGYFEFQAHADSVVPNCEEMPLEMAVLEAARMIDELRRAAGVIPETESQPMPETDSEPEESEIDVDLDLDLDLDSDLGVGGDEAGEGAGDDDLDLGEEVVEVGQAPAVLDPAAVLRSGPTDPAGVDDLDKTQQAILDLAQVGMTVGRALSVIPEDEPALVEALTDLVERGLVELGD